MIKILKKLITIDCFDLHSFVFQINFEKTVNFQILNLRKTIIDELTELLFIENFEKDERLSLTILKVTKYF